MRIDNFCVNSRNNNPEYIMSRLVLAAVLALALHAIGWDGELGSGDAASGNVGSGDAGSGNDVIGNSNAFGSGEVALVLVEVASRTIATAECACGIHHKWRRLGF